MKLLVLLLLFCMLCLNLYTTIIVSSFHTREVTGWAFAHAVNQFAHPVNQPAHCQKLPNQLIILHTEKYLSFFFFVFVFVLTNHEGESSPKHTQK